MKLAALAVVGLSLVGACALQPRPAQAATCAPAHSFAIGELLTAANMNANPQKFAQCFNNLDNTNIGPAGIFANQIIPTTVAQATFGGSQSYTFPSGITQLRLTTPPDNYAILFPNGTSGTTAIYTNRASGTPVNTVAAQILGVGTQGGAGLLSLDGAGNLGVAGGLYAGGVTSPGTLSLGASGRVVATLDGNGNFDAPYYSTPAGSRFADNTSITGALSVPVATVTNETVNGALSKGGGVGTYPFLAGLAAGNPHIEVGFSQLSNGSATVSFKQPFTGNLVYCVGTYAGNGALPGGTMPLNNQVVTASGAVFNTVAGSSLTFSWMCTGA